MTDLSQIIEVQISRETTAVARASFSIPMILSAHTAFAERAREYTNLSGVAADFATTSNVYKMAALVFGQELKPTKLVVGRRQVPSVTVTPVVQNSALYRFVVSNGTQSYTISFTSDADATAAEIVTGLGTAFTAAGVVGVTFTAQTSQFSIAPTVVGTGYEFEVVSTNLQVVNAAPSESITSSLEAVQAVNDTWYGLLCDSHAESDILSLAAAIEGKKKIYVTSTQDVAVKGNGDTDVGSQLKAFGYVRTALLYSAFADADFPEAAWVGGQLPEQPGSNTWAYKTLSGVRVSALNATESANLANKNVSTFEEIGGVRATTGGKTGSGEFIDVIITVDWIESRIRENVWFRLVNSRKLPFTAAGAAVIEAEIRRVMTEGISVGALADAPAPRVTVPNVLDLDPNLRALRRLDGVTFEARLAGAIHFTTIRGVLTV